MEAVGTGTINIAKDAGTASIGATTSTTSTGVYLAAPGGGTLNYGGAITVDQGNVLSVTTGNTSTIDLSGAITSTSSGTAFDFRERRWHLHDFGRGDPVRRQGRRCRRRQLRRHHLLDASKTFSTGANDAVEHAGSGSLSFTGGGLGITTSSGTGFNVSGGAVTVSGIGNTIDAASGSGLFVINATVGAAGVRFDSITSGGGSGVDFGGDVLDGNIDIRSLTATGSNGAFFGGLSGSGQVDMTGTIDIDTSSIGLEFSGGIGTVNIANAAGSTLTIDGSAYGIDLFTFSSGTANVAAAAGTASIGATNSTSTAAIEVSTNTGGTLNYGGSIAVDTGDVLYVSGGDLATVNLSGATTSTTSGTAFDFADADGTYTISGTVDHTGGVGVSIDSASSGGIGFTNAVTISAPATTGISLAGTGTASFDTVNITNLPANTTGIDATNASGTVTFGVLTITGASTTGTTGIDLTGNTNTLDFSTAATSAISGVAAGVDLTTAGITGTFQFGDGEDTVDVRSSISATTPIVIAGLNSATGTYNFLDATLAGDTSGLTVDAFFVEEGASGAGTLTDPGSLADAELSGAGNIVLLNAGGSDVITTDGSNGDDTLNLAADRVLAAFGAGDTLNLSGGAPANVELHGIVAGTVTNPFTGSDAPTLTSSDATATVKLADGDELRGLSITNSGGGAAVYVSGADGGTLTNLSIGGVTGIGLSFVNTTGTFTATDVDILNATSDAILIDGGTASFDFDVDSSIGQNGGSVLHVQGGHATGTFGFAGAITSTTGGTAFDFADADGTYTISGAVTQSVGKGVDVAAASSGAITFSNASKTFSTAANTAVSMAGTGTLAFTNGGLGITTTTALALNGTAGTLNITGAGNTVTSGDGQTINLNGMVLDVTLTSVDSTRTTGGNAIHLENLDGSFTLNGGTIFAPATSVDFNAIELLQNDSSNTRSLTAAFDGVTITQDATSYNSNTQRGIYAQTQGDDSLFISIDNSSFETEDQATYLDGVNSKLTVTGFANNTLLGQATAARPELFQNGAIFAGVIFNSDPNTAGLQTVNGGTFTAGTSPAPSFTGLYIENNSVATHGNSGTLEFTSVDIHSYQTLVATGNQSSMTLKIDSGTIAGQSLSLAPSTSIALDITLSSLTLDAAGGISTPFAISNATGSFTVTGATSITAPEQASSSGGFYIRHAITGMSVSNSSADFTFGTIDIPTGSTTASSYVVSTGGPTVGIDLENNSGSFTVTGATTISETVEDGIRIVGTSGAIGFGTTTVTDPHADLLYSGTIIPTRETSSAAVDISGTVTAPITFGSFTATLQNANAVGIQLSGSFDTVDIATQSGETLAIDGGQYGILLTGMTGGAANIANGAGAGSIGATTSPSDAAIYLTGNTGGTLNYGGTIKATTGNVLSVAGGDLATATLSGDITSTTSSVAFDFADADGTYTISGDIDHTGGTGVSVASASGGTITFSGMSKSFSTGGSTAVDMQGTGTLSFTNGGLAITTTSGPGFHATRGTVSVTGGDNTITSSNGNGLQLGSVTIGSSGITFADISAGQLGIGMVGTTLDGAVTVDSLTATGSVGIDIFAVSGSGALTVGSADLDASAYGMRFTGSIGTVNIATSAADTLTVDGGIAAIYFNNVSSGVANIGTSGAAASIGSTTSPSTAAISLNGNTGGTLNYGGTINATTGNVFSAAGGDLATATLSGAITSTTSGTAFDFADADGTYTVSGAIGHTGGVGVSVDSDSSGAITFSNASKTFSTGANNAVDMQGTGTLNFTGGGLGITTTTGTGFSATAGTVVVTGGVNSNTINAASGYGLYLDSVTVGAGGVTFDSIISGGGTGLTITASSLTGAVNIGGLTSTGVSGVIMQSVTGSGGVNLTGTINLDDSVRGLYLSGNLGTVNIANATGSTLTIDGGPTGIDMDSVGTGTINIAKDFGTASIGATTSTTSQAILAVNGGGTLNYGGTINVTAGNVLSVTSANASTINLSGAITSTTTSTAFDFVNADGTYTISGAVDHTGGVGVSVDSASSGTVTFSGTSKSFNTGANNAVDMQGTGTLAFTNGGLDLTTTGGTAFYAYTTSLAVGTVTVSGAGNTATSSSSVGVYVNGYNIGADGLRFDHVTSGGGNGITLHKVTLNGDVDIRGLTATGVNGAAFSFLSGTGEVDLTGTIDIDTSGAGLYFFNTIGTVNVANTAGSTLTIDGGVYGLQFTDLTSGTANIGTGAGTASIGATTSTSSAGIFLDGDSGGTLNYGGTLNVSTGNVFYTDTFDAATANLSGAITSTTSGTAFNLVTADGTYTISGTVNLTAPGTGISIDSNSGGNINFTNTVTIATPATAGMTLAGTGTITFADVDITGLAGQCARRGCPQCGGNSHASTSSTSPAPASRVRVASISPATPTRLISPPPIPARSLASPSASI